VEIYVLPIGHGFSFFGHEKLMLKKRGHPVSYLLVYLTEPPRALATSTIMWVRS